MAGLPGAAQDRVPAHVPGTRPGLVVSAATGRRMPSCWHSGTRTRHCGGTPAGCGTSQPTGPGSPRWRVLRGHVSGEPVTGAAPGLQPLAQVGHQPHLAADHLRVIALRGQILAEAAGIRRQRAAHLSPGPMPRASGALHSPLPDSNQRGNNDVENWISHLT